MLNLVANGPSGYTISNSLRLRRSASAYLSRTPASAGNQTTWTYSAWIKRGQLGADQILITAGSTNNDMNCYITGSGDQIYWFNRASGTFNALRQTTQVFRDPSAWYHIVLVWDTTNATASNRMRIYVNGVQVTAFASSTDPSSSMSGQWNGTSTNRICSDITAGSNTFDGYITEVNFIDGQALTPSSFGSTNSLTGVWQPAKYTGTYGTNGFYLPFTDNSALTTASNVGLGKDFSGNGNYWVTNNISITAGTTYDSMTDVPTLTSATVANYAVLSPLGNAVGSSPSGYLSNANLTVSGNANAGYLGTMSIPAGKYYFEGTLSTLARQSFGLCSATISMSQDFGTNLNYYGFYFNPAGNYIDGSANPWAATAPSAGSIVQVAVDATNLASINFWVGINNVWYNSTGGTTGNPSTGANPTQVITANVPLFPLCTLRSGASSTTNLNFGQRPFSYTPPTGYVALNTYNL